MVRCIFCGKPRHVATHCWHRQRAERERRQEEYARNLQEALGRDDESLPGSEMDQIGEDSGSEDDDYWWSRATVGRS